MPLVNWLCKFARYLRHRANRSCLCFGTVLLPEQLEPRKMLTGDTSTPDGMTSSDTESESITLAHAIGSESETFSSADLYADWLVEQSVQQWQHVLGKPAFQNPWIGLQEVNDVVITHGRGEIGHPNTTVDDNSSSTRTQIQGVDEADFVEVENDTLYTLAHDKLSIVRGFSEASPELLDQVTVETLGQTVGMYLYGDTLTIVSQRQANTTSTQLSAARWGSLPPLFGRPQTGIVVLDVSDAADVSIVQRLTIDGLLASSRMVNGQLRLVLDHHMDLPPPNIIASASSHDGMVGPKSPYGIQSHRAISALGFREHWSSTRGPQKPAGMHETAEAYSLRVRQRLVELMTPQVYQVDASGNPLNVAVLASPTVIDVPQAGAYQQLTTVTSIDVTRSESQPAVTVGFFTKGSTQLFATADNMYVFDEYAGFSWGDVSILPWSQQVTDVTKVTFSLNESGAPVVSLAAQGSFRGNVLNQFAADEQEDFLRIVVETWGEGSGVVVLEHQGDSLVEVGALRGLASNENLYSVRFVDSRAYFVTFRQTDPLFVVDLHSPTNPVLLGELHVPGFSDHIQPIDENYLLTIGSDADEETGRMQGLQVSIFDVSDPVNPLLLHRHALTRDSGSSTEITGNRRLRGDGDHLALGFFPEQGVMTVPVQARGHANWDRNTSLPIVFPEPRFEDSIRPVSNAVRGSGWKVPRQYLEVLSFDTESGISSLGVVDHASRINRAVHIEGYLVGVSAGEVSVHSFSDPNTTLASVVLDEITIGGPMKASPDRQRPDFLAIGQLVDQSVAGLPLHASWLIKETEVIGNRQVLYAEHASGVVHRMVSTKPVEEADWSAFGFDSIHNLESRVLSRLSTGNQEPSGPSSKQVQALVSDAILNQLNLVRESSGRIRRQLFAPDGGLPNDGSQ